MLAGRLKKLFILRRNNLFSVYWTYSFIILAVALNVTTFFATMGLLYLMLTSDGKPEDSIYPQVIDVIKGVLLL